MPRLDTWRGAKKPEGTRAFMGWDGVVVADDSVDVLDMLRAYMERAAGESCGQCFPCRHGLSRIVAILDRLCSGEAPDGYRERLLELATLVSSSARCDIGQTTPRPLLDILESAPHLLAPVSTSKKRYASIVTAPCMSACPSHVNIPDYLEKIRFRQYGAALETVRTDCSLPGTIGRVCVRPCEQSCKRGRVDAPLAIRHLKRFLADEEVKHSPHPIPKKPRMGNRKVAVVGAGPAGLSCAYYLARRGVLVAIFEILEAPGGMAKFGIPPYRLPTQVLAREVEHILAEGCTIHYGVGIGRDVSLHELEAQGFEAVFIATGAPESSRMRCEGEDEGYTGFMPGIAYLGEVARGNRPVSGERVVVIGGGNVAMDCVRTAKRQGFEDVHLLYRRTQREMPADRQEIEEAKEEGVVFNFLVAPVKILAEDGKVTGLLCQKMELGEPDDSGRRRPVPMENGAFVLPCDVIIPAIGQTVAVDFVMRGVEGKLTRWGTLEADPLTGQASGLDRIFGGGDCVTGPDTLIAAIAAGKRSATHIWNHLNGIPAVVSDSERLTHIVRAIGAWNETEPKAFKGYSQQLAARAMHPDERIRGFAEVEFGASDTEAATEAARCLRCYRLAMASF